MTLILLSQDGKNSQEIDLVDMNHAPSKVFESLSDRTDIQFYFDKNKTTTTLPREMNCNLIKFLKQGKPNNPDYCCINFSYELLYGRGAIKDDNSISSFNGYTFQEQAAMPGTMVYLYKTAKNEAGNKQINKHFAVCIGEGYYLSIHGVNGPMAIADLNSMKEYCQGNECLEVTVVPEIKSMLSNSTHSIKPKSSETKNTSSTRTEESSNRFSFYAVATGLVVAGAVGAAMSRKVT
jgi:hypothetical protein